MDNKTTIGIVGLWHLGCVLSAAWSKLGFKVISFDYSKDLIDSLNRNQLPIFEPNLKEMLKQVKDKGRLNFTNDIKKLSGCKFVFLAYDIPVLDNDESDLSILEKAIDDIGGILKDETVVIISSQVPIGTCKKFRKRLKEINPSLELVYSPENLRLGQAIDCYLNPERIILGVDCEDAKAKVSLLFKNIKAKIIMMNIASAEMVKHGINAFLANSIVFANQLSDLCEVSEADILDVVNGIKSDPRIGEKAYLSAGIGFSGGTLGRDLKALSRLNENSHNKSYLFETIHKLNTDRKYIILNKISNLLGKDLNKKTISVLGLTYKPGTSTLRRSLPLEIVKLLSDKGAILNVFDPKADYKELNEPWNFQICNSIDEAIAGSDLIVILTEWEEFKNYDWGKNLGITRGKKIFDTKNFLDISDLSKKGYSYFGVGYIK